MVRTITVLIVLFFAAPMLLAQEAKEKILAGWMGVFPENFNYQRTFEKPKAEKDRWRQAARSDWSGGRLETIRVTLTRDADEAKKYQFSDAKPAPKDVAKLR